jgi:general secretion pathway protein J
MSLLSFRNDGEAGFTVVELMVAVALLSILGVVVLNVLQIGISSWTQSVQHSERSDEDDLTSGLLRRLLAEAYPHYLSTGARPRADFAGTLVSLSFLASGPAVLGRKGRWRFTLSVADVGGQSAMTLAARPELAAPNEDVIKRTLLSNVRSIAFAYFGSLSGHRDASWHNQWLDQPVLPRLIRLRVQRRNAEPWTDFTIAPLIEADVGCVFDLLTRRCQGR